MSLFVDAEPSAIDWAAEMGGDRVELYTEPFAKAFAHGEAAATASFHRFADARAGTHTTGAWASTPATISTWTTSPLFRTLPHLAEVSIGHAIVSRALFVGLARTVREYLAVLHGDAA